MNKVMRAQEKKTLHLLLILERAFNIEDGTMLGLKKKKTANPTRRYLYTTEEQIPKV